MRSRIRSLSLVVALLPTVVACSTSGARHEPVAVSPPGEPPAVLPQPAPPPAPQTGGAEASTAAQPEAVSEHDLLRFAQGFMGLSREAQRQVLGQVETLYNQDRSAQNLVRYALLAVVTSSDRPAGTNRVRSDLRAYLDPKTGGERDEEELAPLAGVLLRVLDDREQLTAQFVAQNDQLQKKLDELKAIEQQLLERSDPANRAITP